MRQWPTLDLHLAGTQESVANIWFDTFEHARDNTSNFQYVIRTNHGDWEPSSPLWFLLLRPSAGRGSWGLTLGRLPNGAYHRIGYIEGEANVLHEFAKHPRKVITII
jgi:hypothetical protein